MKSLRGEGEGMTSQPWGELVTSQGTEVGVTGGEKKLVPLRGVPIEEWKIEPIIHEQTRYKE